LLFFARLILSFVVVAIAGSITEAQSTGLNKKMVNTRAIFYEDSHHGDGTAHWNKILLMQGETIRLISCDDGKSPVSSSELQTYLGLTSSKSGKWCIIEPNSLSNSKLLAYLQLKLNRAVFVNSSAELEYGTLTGRQTVGVTTTFLSIDDSETSEETFMFLAIDRAGPGAPEMSRSKFNKKMDVMIPYPLFSEKTEVKIPAQFH
jgi:hypothetical protein